jgi:hypothetical protein
LNFFPHLGQFMSAIFFVVLLILCHSFFHYSY